MIKNYVFFLSAVTLGEYDDDDDDDDADDIYIMVERLSVFI